MMSRVQKSDGNFVMSANGTVVWYISRVHDGNPKANRYARRTDFPCAWRLYQNRNLEFITLSLSSDVVNVSAVILEDDYNGNYEN
jgi:hypothetical protein